jgi:hypothetical protein
MLLFMPFPIYHSQSCSHSVLNNLRDKEVLLNKFALLVFGAAAAVVFPLVVV